MSDGAERGGSALVRVAVGVESGERPATGVRVVVRVSETRVRSDMDDIIINNRTTTQSQTTHETTTEHARAQECHMPRSVRSHLQSSLHSWCWWLVPPLAPTNKSAAFDPLSATASVHPCFTHSRAHAVAVLRVSAWRPARAGIPQFLGRASWARVAAGPAPRRSSRAPATPPCRPAARA